MFGTSGIRKIFAGYGEDQKNFTPSQALKLGLAIGTYFNGGTIIIGRDIRTTAIPIELAITSGLITTGCRVVPIGTVTTPTVAMSMHFLGTGDCGIMVTASHNTPEYIGIKLWNPSGLAFTQEQEMQLESIYNQEKFNTVAWDKIGAITPVNDVNTLHVNEILKQLDLGPNLRPNVIIDPGNGSSFEIAPLLIKKLGCKFATLNSNPDGHFPGRLSEPNSKNLQRLISFVKSTDDIDFGIALDGDADRVIFIDGKGRIVEPIRLLAFLSKAMLLKDPPRNGTTYKIITPINSSSVLEHVVQPIFGEVIRTQVGDAKVAMQVKKLRAIIGGENSGTYIWPKFHLGPDSLVTIAKVIEILSYSEKKFTDLMDEIPEFPFLQKEYPLVEDIPINESDYQSYVEPITQMLKSQGCGAVDVNTLDGIRFDFQNGWIMIRRSGTSPIMRIVGEHKDDKSKLNTLIEKTANVLKNEFKII